MLEADDYNGVKSVWSLAGKEQYQPRQLKGAKLDETALMCYSSGTTGLPKGVRSTHRNLWHISHQVQAAKPILEKQSKMCTGTRADIPLIFVPQQMSTLVSSQCITYMGALRGWFMRLDTIARSYASQLSSRSKF
jgi:long-subunit acyl-CoA synthetase (AMP-forming)